MNILRRVVNYIKNNGFIGSIKGVFRKIFKFKSKVNNKLRNFKLNLSDREKKDVVLKKGIRKSIVVFGTVPYYDVGGGQRSSQISKIFNSMGYLVSYVYAFDSSESKIYDMEIPLYLHKNIDRITIEEFDELVSEGDLVIFEAPIKKFIPFLELAHSKKVNIVYENIDNWETSLGSMFFDEECLKLMLKYSNMVVATAELLVEQTKAYFKKYDLPEKEVYYLANAVNDELFDPKRNFEKPKDLIQGTKTLLYYGSLWGEWFDWELISEVALSDSNISINLIGDERPIKNKINELPKNVHFLGLKKQTDLPAYLVYSDFAILPFKCSDIGNYVSPLKIFEYISMNKYVLATPLPDISNYPNCLFSNDAKEWIKKINEDINVDIEKRNDFIQNNNWNSRCSAILDNIYVENSKKCNEKYFSNISVVVLNYNNKKVIFNCIDTLIKYNQRYNYEIIVVDNNSSDGSYEMLIEKYKENDFVKVVRNQKNGCSSGRNLGVKNSKNEYILFLDSDEWVLNKYFLDSYIDILENDENIGVVGWSAGWFNNSGYAYKYIAWYRFNYMYPHMLYRKDVGYLATCGFMLKKELFEQVGGFDEFYDPTCYEDTDLSLAIRNSGKETVFSTYLGVGHIPHQTTKSGTDSHAKLLKEKGDYFVNKWKDKNPSLLSNYIKK